MNGKEPGNFMLAKLKRSGRLGEFMAKSAKTGRLLAAASVVAVSVGAVSLGGGAPAHAAAAPMHHEEKIVAAADSVAPPLVQEASAVPSKAWYAAGAAAILALLIRLIGVRRVREAIAAAGPATIKVARQTAKATAHGVAATASAARQAVKGPFRRVFIFAGLSFVGLAGFGLYDIEWLGGMNAGGLLAGASLVATSNIRRRVAAVFVKDN